MRLESYTQPEYVAAFRELVSRIEASVKDVRPDALPVRMYVAGGAARLLYFDRQYNDTLGLMHEDARGDSMPLTLDGIDPNVLDVRLLAPLDLAVSKLGRFSDEDRADIAALARRGLLKQSSLKSRATEALRAYVGDTGRIPRNIRFRHLSPMAVHGVFQRNRPESVSQSPDITTLAALLGGPCSFSDSD